jgi:hypothetical protein
MGNKDLLEKIKQERDNKAKIYTKTYPEMVAEYQRELETIKGYNGRQILELLQNCDDQSAKNVKIVVNTENGIFSIENDGESFSLEGYRSLFIANLSSKVNKQKYIGNKGLGFRSIINWSSELEIISNNISLLYSNKLTKNFFENTFNEEDRNKIRIEFNKGDNEIPVALLAMPSIKEFGSHDYATKIQIKYKETELKHIIEQINVIDTDSLLFLNSIQKICIVVDEEVKEYVKNADKVSVVARSTDGAGVLAKHADEAGAWLHGGKVFRYSDETAEAVASGEKLLKESGTIYESFADMMSPEDAKRYLDFLENGSREGLTSAELVGVEKADALLVSQKVGYEDVWDLRNAGDALESGRESSIKDYSNRFADSLVDDFNTDVEVRDVVKEDMILVQFSSDAPNASLRYWTTIDEANGISTIEEYMDKMALSKEWGNRNVVQYLSDAFGASELN